LAHLLPPIVIQANVLRQMKDYPAARRLLEQAVAINEAFWKGPHIETASALERALTMSREDRGERMRLMRRTVKHNNVFRWAGRMLVDAAQIRQLQRFAEPAIRRAG